MLQPTSGRIQRNTSLTLGSNPSRLDRGLVDDPRKPHKLAFYGATTTLGTPLPTLINGEIVFPGAVMDGGSEYRVPYADLLRATSNISSVGRAGVYRAECTVVDCRSSDALSFFARFENSNVEGLLDTFEHSTYFDNDCDAAVDTCVERIPRFVAEANAKQTRIVFSMITGAGAEAGKFYLGWTTDIPRLASFSTEGFGAVTVLTQPISRDLFARQLGSWGRPGLGAGNVDNPIMGFQMQYRYYVDQDANEGGSSNPYAYGQSLLVQTDSIVVAFDVTNDFALAAFTEMSTILLGTKTPASLYNQRLSVV